jgi:hypothetical protein
MYYVTYNKPNKISDALMDKAILFASDFLQIDEDIEVDFGDKFEKDRCGYCDYDEDGISIAINPKMKKVQIITTLFHEMVHAKQYVNEELVSGEGSSPSRWMGEECDVPYLESPWEREAYELEAVMLDIFRPNFWKQEKSC